MPPPAWHSGSVIVGRSARFSGRRNASCSPCSMREVSVTPRRSASCRARSRRFSSNRTVVLICQSILIVCLYVKNYEVSWEVTPRRRWSQTSKEALDQLASMGEDDFVIVDAARVRRLAGQTLQLFTVFGERDQVLGQCAPVPNP